MIRYVEGNALRVGLVKRAQAWRWCSLRWREHLRDHGDEKAKALLHVPGRWSARAIG